MNSPRIWIRRGMAYWAAALLFFVVAGCRASIKPSPYQVALKSYYRTLLSGATDEGLKASIASVTQNLQNSPADAGLLALRASARLERIRLGVEAKPDSFDDVLAAELFSDLRLLQNLLDQAGNHPPWLPARVFVSMGDAIALKCLAMPKGEGQAKIHQNIVQRAMFRLAADYYLHAAALAGQAESDIKGNTELEGLHLPGIRRELANARDGYANVTSGMAQSEEFLRQIEAARQHLEEASALVTETTAFPPAIKVPLTPRLLYRYSHRSLALQAEALETLAFPNPAEQLGLAQLALKEDLAARLLSNPVEPVRPSDLAIVSRIAAYLNATTSQRAPLAITTGDVNSEKISFTLRPDPLYSALKIPAPIPWLTLHIGEERFPIPFSNSKAMLPSFMRPEGIAIAILTRKGTPSFDQQKGVEHFLNRDAPVLSRGKTVTVRGPGDNLIGTAMVE
jgi:hypothetical protein